jgi:hypothetical protein
MYSLLSNSGHNYQHIGAGRVAQVVECLPNKCEAHPGTARKEKKKKTITNTLSVYFIYPTL